MDIQIRFFIGKAGGGAGSFAILSHADAAHRRAVLLGEMSSSIRFCRDARFIFEHACLLVVGVDHRGGAWDHANGALHDQLQAQVILICVVRADPVNGVTDLVRLASASSRRRSVSSGRMGKVGSSCQRILVHELTMIFPLVGHPCKFCSHCRF